MCVCVFQVVLKHNSDSFGVLQHMSGSQAHASAVAVMEFMGEGKSKGEEKKRDDRSRSPRVVVGGGGGGGGRGRGGRATSSSSSSERGAWFQKTQIMCQAVLERRYTDAHCLALLFSAKPSAM